jgi:hypothetical protein
MEYIMKRQINKNKDSQMILLAGIMITILVLSMSIVSINLSNVGVSLSLEKNISPLEEYKNLRTVFTKVFNASCSKNSDPILVEQAFEYTKNTLFQMAVRRGFYFEAELINIQNYDSNHLNVTANLNFVCSNTVIEEQIRTPVYVIT